MVLDNAYEAARRHAAIIDRNYWGRLTVTGPDRASYLQGLLTNDIAALRPGLGCYAAYLTPQGRMISDLLVYEVGHSILICVPAATKGTVFHRFSDFIFTEDVAVGDATDALWQIGIVGPEAAERLAAIFGGSTSGILTALPEHGNVKLDDVAHDPWRGAFVTRTADAGEAGFDVYLEPAAAGALRSELEAAGTPVLDEDTAEAIRIESGIPRFGRDMDEETIPLEAGIESRAISFTKGCYVGQEVIVRILHRGHGRIARRLSGIAVERSEGGEAPTAVPRPGAHLLVDEREVGRITSAAWSPSLSRPVALAYLHRDVLEPGTAVIIESPDADGHPGAGRRIAGIVTPLPFVRQ